MYTHRCDPFEPRGPGAERAIANHNTTEVTCTEEEVQRRRVQRDGG